jgi:tetratricopeptide (TPR) repeat protein
MSNGSDWQWVDEDPIEKLLRPAPGPATGAGGSSPEALIARGRAQFARQLFEEAADSFRAVIAAEPRHRTAHFDLAVCLEKLERWAPAADSFRRSLEIDSTRWQALVGLGSCLLYLDAPEEALSCFERCLDIGAPPEAVLLGKGVALQKLARLDEAEEAYRDLLDIVPGSVEPLTNLIGMSAARGDSVAIAEYSSRLLKTYPQSKSALQGLAMLAIAKGDQAAAINYCTRLVEVDPDSFEGRFNLRFVQQKMRQPGKSARSIA